MNDSPLHAAPVRGALVISSETGPSRTVAFQYNPEALQRDLQPRVRSGGLDDHVDASHYLGAPAGTVSIEVMLDATQALARGDATALQYGVLPQLAVLETLLMPASSTVTQANASLAAGVLEIDPFVAPTVLLVFGKNRSIPVQLTGLSVRETFHDTQLNPVRAEVTLQLRLLTWSDVSTANPAGRQFLAYQQHLELLARKAGGA